MDYLIYIVALINLTSIILMYVDKKKAVRHQWRIPERTLFTMAIIGGSLGILVGMYLFRHKTKHASFTVGIPVILMLQVYLVYRFINA